MDTEALPPDAYDCRIGIEFPIAKLLDHADRIDALHEDANPFALLVAAHLRTRATRHDPQARYQAKLALVRALYRRGWDKQRILDLFAVIDWMMRLPDGLERKLWQDIQQIEGEQRMRYVTSIERLATERGMQQGMQQGLLAGRREDAASILERLLVKRFGPLPGATRERIRNASLEQLDHWTDRLLDAPSLVSLFDGH